jgi:hypothetical protein
MPAGDKSKYTKKQKLQAEHIEEIYEARGYSEKEAERRAWDTVDRSPGNVEIPDGSGYGGEDDHEAMPRAGKRSDVHRDATNRDEIEPE